jgi:LacI family transcriptional regulator
MAAGSKMAQRPRLLPNETVCKRFTQALRNGHAFGMIAPTLDQGSATVDDIGPKGRATIRDVAAAAGVSTGTVSRVAAGNPRISQATRARVLEAMGALAYQPNAAARAMRTNVTRTVGLMLPNIVCPVFIRMMAGAEEVLAQHNYMLFAFSSDSRPDREVAFLKAAEERQMDGIILSVCDESAPETIAALRRVRMPIAIVDRDLPIEADRVEVEHTVAFDAVMEHLISMGHRRIGLIASGMNRPGKHRIATYRKALARHNIACDERLIRSAADCGRGADYGAAEAYDLMTASKRPTALIAAGADFFQGALRSVRTLGLSIPDDISFVGADDPTLGEIAGPPITVIDRDMREAGRQAARLLLERFSGVTLPPRRLMLTSNVMLRRSVGPVIPPSDSRPLRRFEAVS